MSSHRETFLTASTDATAVEPVCVVIYRTAEGEIAMHTTTDHREAQRFENIVEDQYGQVLLRVEGEHDLATGERSVWTR